LTFDEKATVEKVDASKISKKDIKTQKLPLYELVERSGALDVEVEGTIIKIREGSGLVQRCPNCNRVLQGSDCSIHGTVKGLLDLRIKLVIDDGTGAVSSIINKDSTEKLLGKSFDELTKMLEKSEDKNIIFEEINNTLFAHRINLQGNALGDEFGITIIAKNAKLADINVEDESKILYKELEELQ
jgi:replication factor A1